MYATTFQISWSSRLGQAAIAVPRTPWRMARKVLPAELGSDHGGSVRFAGGGTNPSLRTPWPSPLLPWQMAQWAAKIAAPACWASRDANRPAGGLGTSGSHPEMTSETVNRAQPSSSLRLSNQLVAKALHLTNDRFDKLVELAIDCT